MAYQRLIAKVECRAEELNRALALQGLEQKPGVIVL